jgi:hypothetical protein
VLVREPDQLGVERAHPQLAFGARLVELAEANRHVAADDDRTPARLGETRRATELRRFRKAERSARVLACERVAQHVRAEAEAFPE